VGKYTERDAQNKPSKEWIYHVMIRYNQQKTVELERYKEFQEGAFVCMMNPLDIMNETIPVAPCEARLKFTFERNSNFAFVPIHQSNFVIYYLNPGPQVQNKNHEFYACFLEYDQNFSKEMINSKSTQCGGDPILMFEPNSIFSEKNFVLWKIEEKSVGYPVKKGVPLE
jgi:hypothetical protein